MAHFANLAYGLVRTPPSPPSSGPSLVLEPGHGARMPTLFPFEATIWPVSAMPDPTNAEIVTVTAITGDTLSITRARQGTVARTILAGDQLAATITKAYLDVVPLTTDPAINFTGSVTVNGALNSGSLVTGGVTVGTLQVNGGASVTGNLGVTGVVLSPRLRGYREPYQIATLTSAPVKLPIDYAAGNHVIVLLSANVTGITITNLPIPGDVASVMVYYQAVAGGHTVVHTINDVAVRFATGPPLVMATLDGRYDRVLYTTWDAGGTWLGDVIGTNY